MIILDNISSSYEFNKTDYFEMATDELNYRINSIHKFYPQLSAIGDIRTLYSKLTENFSNEEIEAIKYYHTLINYMFKNKLPRLCPNTSDIKYIKLKKNIDWNYPYTINHCVVLPELFLKEIVDSFHTIKPIKSNKVWNLTRPNYKTINKIACNICHEWIHITQRYKLTSELEDIYINIWGFNKTPIEPKKGFITNPDGKNGVWSTIIDGIKLYPIVILKNDIPTGGLFDSTSGIVYDYTESYIRRFGGIRDQLYHPNEIFANLVSRYIIYNTMLIPNWNSSDFYFSLNRFL